MAKKQTKDSLKALMSYLELSKLLFADGDDCPYLINELPSGTKLYKQAKALAKEMEINWKKMSVAESNSIMLEMLHDTYQSVKQVDNKRYIVQITIKESEITNKKPENDHEDQCEQPDNGQEQQENDQSEQGDENLNDNETGE